ncbi:efflux RND transporter periplasmic adaptor subunit [uncultured Microbulbifer sp.]|uniref:efflux RND transporter periplasmic adaptor subunit n=1 Tax=uncultured Microbulbifer sp. TaxID=348147 RepID=UPI0025EE6626|nr:efflux RND transporter periplasmic adaptor subunit [uncultured Microbulbifer sp.]
MGYRTDVPASAAEAEQGEPDPEMGPNRGRMLREGDFAVELAIFETGVPPEFRVWVTDGGKPVDPKKVHLKVVLTRLGGKEEHVSFAPQENFLRGDTVIHEPHSFVVSVTARYNGNSHHWQYDSFEGRTRIEPSIAEAMDIGTGIAGPAVLRETRKAYGRLVMNPERVRVISARFDGTVESVRVGLGERVSKGQPLIAINSNENLKTYSITSPIEGVVLQRLANPGEQTDGRALLTIADSNALLAELDVFPATRARIKQGAPVALNIRGLDVQLQGVVQQIDTMIRPNQSSVVRVALNNPPADLAPGGFVAGEIQVAEFEVPLAVKRSGLQAYRDFTVVYIKIGDEYEVRMLELGREAGDWVEVLGGLEAGAEYVTENSYIIKADIEKSGASHDH